MTQALRLESNLSKSPIAVDNGFYIEYYNKSHIKLKLGSKSSVEYRLQAACS